MTQNSDDNTYGFNIGGINSYVVPTLESELVIVDALDVVPEYQIIEKGKKKKRLYFFGGILLFVIVLLVAITVVALTSKKRGKNDTKFVPDIDPYSASTPSIAPSTSLTIFTKLLSAIESRYDRIEQVDTTFLNESSPQYRAAAWVADSISILGINASDDRMITRFALATFYFATNGDEWFKCGRESTNCQVSQKWLTGANECDWYAIKCSQDGSDIIEIFFPANGDKSNSVTGTLPNELSFLSKLTAVIVARGPISGIFPDWSKMSTLERLVLNNNQFEGSFPTYLLRQNPSLKTIQFQNNSFQGQLFQDLSSVQSTALIDVSVNGNNFTGPIRSQISNLPSLKTLRIGSNGFTGTLPESLYTLSNLISLDISNTQLRGEISADIGALSRLIYFRAGNTEISGTLPTELFSLKQLRTLDLSFGEFTGYLSDSFANLTDLDVALLHNNRFSGTIPSGFEHLSYLNNLELHANDLSGSVPEELCDRQGYNHVLTADCLGNVPEVSCTCCTNCPQGI